MRTRKKKLKESSKISMRVITVVVLFLFGVLTYKTIELKEQASAYEATIDGYEKDMKELKKERKEIEELRDYVNTDSYIEEVAREKLGLVYEDEIVFETDDQE